MAAKKKSEAELAAEKAMADLGELRHQLAALKRKQDLDYSALKLELEIERSDVVKKRVNAIKPFDSVKQAALLSAKDRHLAATTTINSRYDAGVAKLRAIQAEELAKVQASYNAECKIVRDKFNEDADKLHAEYKLVLAGTEQRVTATLAAKAKLDAATEAELLKQIHAAEKSLGLDRENPEAAN